jgi:tetratricopeptide (TPR) repeat protein
MLKTRIILVTVSAIIIALIFMLPKAVVENESEMKGADTSAAKHATASAQPHSTISPEQSNLIKEVRAAMALSSSTEKNAIFADSLQNLYAKAGMFDSAAWFGKEAATFFNTTKSFLKAGNNYYEAFTFAMDEQKRKAMAEQAREWLTKAIKTEPKNYEARIKVAMTYLASGGPMQGIRQMREVLSEDPKNELALFNMGMLSIQSGQYAKAEDWLKQLAEVNPNHVQGQVLLGVALMNEGKKEEARKQFEKLKNTEKDPAVLATIDSYLAELK